MQLCAVCALYFGFFIFVHAGAHKCTQVHIGAETYPNVRLCAVELGGVQHGEPRIGSYRRKQRGQDAKDALRSADHRLTGWTESSTMSIPDFMSVSTDFRFRGLQSLMGKKGNIRRSKANFAPLITDRPRSSSFETTRLHHEWIRINTNRAEEGWICKWLKCRIQNPVPVAADVRRRTAPAPRPLPNSQSSSIKDRCLKSTPDSGQTDTKSEIR